MNEYEIIINDPANIPETQAYSPRTSVKPDTAPCMQFISDFLKKPDYMPSKNILNVLQTKPSFPVTRV